MMTAERGVIGVRELRLTAILCLLAASGCSSTSVFVSHPRRMNPLIQNVNTGRPIDLTRTLTTQANGQDRILYLLERGRIAQILGSNSTSEADFRAASDAISVNDRKAMFTLSGGGSEVAAALLNDNAIPYESYGYERVFLHNFQAINYLQQRKLDDAGVEIRIANAEQEAALASHEREVDRAVAKAREKNFAASLSSPELSTRLAAMDSAAGQVKNSFQNAYTFYVSAVVWELAGEENDAYIDYKKALEIFPGNSYLQRDVARLSAKLGMEDIPAAAASVAPPAAIPVAPAAPSAPPATTGSTNCVSDAEFDLWLARMRTAYEAKDRVALGTVITEFRGAYSNCTDETEAEHRLVAQVKYPGGAPAAEASAAPPPAIPPEEYQFWLAAYRQPYQAKDRERLAATIAEFRKHYRGNAAALAMESQLVLDVRGAGPPSAPAPEPELVATAPCISDVEFYRWYDRLRIPYEKRDKAGLAAAIADFQKLYRGCPDAEAVQKRLVARIKRHPKPTAHAGTDGELIVLFEEDFVPQKQEVKIPLPIPPANTIVALAFPVYASTPHTATALAISDGTTSLGETEPICYVDALAIKALKEEVPVIVTRQLVRATTKAVGASALTASARRSSRHSPSGSNAEAYVMLGAAIYNLVTENADLRSWTTLPRNAQIMRVRIPTGSQTLSLQHPSGAAATVDCEFRPGGKTILHVVKTGSRLYCRSMSF